MTLKTLDDLLARGLRHLHAAHHQAANHASRSHEAASEPRLREVLRAAAAEHLAQAERLEQAFGLLGLPVASEADPAMQGILDDGTAVSQAMDRSPVLDRELVRSGRVAGRYLAAHYEGLHGFARDLRQRRVARLLARTLAEIERADSALGALAADLRGHGMGTALRLGVVVTGLVGGGVLLLRPPRPERSERATVPTYPFVPAPRQDPSGTA